MSENIIIILIIIMLIIIMLMPYIIPMFYAVPTLIKFYLVFSYLNIFHEYEEACLPSRE